jgi:HSP20 family molecular chaperone IbpA
VTSKLPFDPNNEEHPTHFGDIMKQMNQFFQEKPMRGILQTIDDFFKSPFPVNSFPIDVSENEKDHIVTAKLPGVTIEQIQINVLGNAMSIVVNNQEVITEADENNQLYRKRQSLSQTSRTISLPFQINEKAVKASYKDGLLEIRVPKQAGKKIIIDQE